MSKHMKRCLFGYLIGIIGLAAMLAVAAHLTATPLGWAVAVALFGLAVATV